jgi:hypothetical protein
MKSWLQWNRYDAMAFVILANYQCISERRNQAYTN